MKQYIFQKAVEALNDGIWDWDATTDDVYFSDQLISMLGYTRFNFGQGLGAWKDKVHPVDLPEVMDRISKHLNGEKPFYSSEHRLKCADGSWLWVHDRGRVVERDESGKPLRVIGFHINLDLFKDEYDETNANLRRINQQNDERENILIQVDKNGKILYANPNFLQLYGYSPEQTQGQLLRDFFADADRQSIEGLPHLNGFHQFQATLIEVYQKPLPVVVQVNHNSHGHYSETCIVTIKKQKSERNEYSSLKFKLQLEHLLLEISSDLINEGPEKTDLNINLALAKTGQLMLVDRIYIFLFDKNKETMSNTHEWVASDIEPQKDQLQHIPFSMTPWWMTQLEQNRELNFYDIHDLPEAASAEKSLLEMQDIKSICIVPMIMEGMVQGFIGYDSVKANRVFESETITLLKFFANLVSSAIARANQHARLVNYGQSLEMLVKDQHADLLQTNKKLEETLHQQLALTQQLRRFKVAHETSIHGVAIVGPDETVEYANPALHRMFGFKPDDLTGQKVLGASSPESVETFLKLRSKLISSGGFQNEEVVLRHTEGRTVPVLVNGVIIPYKYDQTSAENFYFAITFVDLSYRKKIEQKLKESEQRYRALFELSKDGIAIMDINGTITESNQQFARWLEQSTEEIRGSNMAEFDTMENGVTVKERIRRVLAEGHQLFESTLLLPNGHKLQTETSSSMVMVDGQQFIMSNSRDISKKMQDEYEKRLLWQVIENAEHGILITSPEGIIRYVNQFYQTKTGYSREELINSPISIFKSGRQKPEYYKKMKGIIQQGNSWRGRIINKTNHKEEIHEEMTIVPIKDQKGVISDFIVLKKDITQEMNIESILKETEKLRAIGTLSGGIAHDFNNILQVVMAQADLLDMVEAKEEQNEIISDIKTAVLKGSKLVKAILSYSKNTQEGIKIIRAEEPVVEALNLFSNVMNKRITLRENIRGTGIIEADLSSIETAFLNILINAQQAIGENGIIEVESKNVMIKVMDEQENEKEMIMYLFRDNGTGMSPAVLNRIYEPFFTTKPVGEGTGLGLPMVFNTITLHNGFIEVDSTEGIGTEFRIFIPIKK